MKKQVSFLLISCFILLVSFVAQSQNICGTPISTDSYITNVPDGDYVVVVTNAYGCTATGSATVTNTNNLTLNPSVSDNHCSGTTGYISAGASGTPPFTYIWSNGETTSYITNVPNGAYTVTVTNAYGCTATASATVTNTNNLTLNPSVSDNHCSGTTGYISAGANGSPPFTYVWSNGETTSYITNVPNGAYTVTVTNAYGCTATASATVTNTNNLTLNPSVSDNHCSGTTGYISAGANGSSPFTYVWSNGETTSYITNVPNGAYTVTVTNAYGCTATASATVTNTNNLTLNPSVSDNHCSGTTGYISAGANGSSPFTYVWSNGETTSYITNVPNGAYTVTVTNAYGCTATASATVTNTNNLTLNPSVSDNHCSGTTGYISAGANGSSPFTYVWSNGETTSYITNVPNGAYTVTVTNAYGCTATASATVTNTNNLTLNPSVSDNHCSGTSGYISAGASGSSPFTYQWYLLTPGSQPIISQNGQLLTSTTASTYQWMRNGVDISGANSQTYTAAVSGTYTVRVTYANGCESASSPIQVQITTGIESFKEGKALSVYPNPAGEFLYLEAAGVEKNNLSVEVYNLVGALVLKEAAIGKIDISRISAGTYIIHASGKGYSGNTMFVKQ